MSSPNSPLSPTPDEIMAQCVGDLRIGLPCVLVSDGIETVMAAVETLSQARLDALCALYGPPQLVIPDLRARAVLPAATGAALTGDPVRIPPPQNAGIDWYRRLCDPTQTDGTGVQAPLHLVRDRDPAMPAAALRVVKTAQLLPAALVFELGREAVRPARTDMRRIEVDSSRDARPVTQEMSAVATALFPIAAADGATLHVFRDPTGQTEHYALEIGSPDRALPVLARLHSACFTGDVLGSLKCDCGPQLRAALARMGAEGAGLLLYLNQEGRGIGLANKMRVYDLQARGLDTVDANHRLGFEDDERDFRVAAAMMRHLGFTATRLLTNNPAKTKTFRAEGITVTEQLALRAGRNAHNENYLATKALKSGHAL